MTTLVDLVAQRIGQEVSELTGAIEYVAEFAALVEEGALPQRDVAAFVVPLGFDAGGGESATGVHTQIINEAVGVILVVKARGDTRARPAVPKVDALVNKIVEKVAGWAPNDSVGVFNVLRGRLVPGGRGVVVYQIEFSLRDQLRIV